MEATDGGGDAAKVTDSLICFFWQQKCLLNRFSNFLEILVFLLNAWYAQVAAAASLVAGFQRLYTDFFCE